MTVRSYISETHITSHHIEERDAGLDRPLYLRNKLYDKTLQSQNYYANILRFPVPWRSGLWLYNTTSKLGEVFYLHMLTCGRGSARLSYTARSRPISLNAGVANGSSAVAPPRVWIYSSAGGGRGRNTPVSSVAASAESVDVLSGPRKRCCGSRMLATLLG